MFDSEFMLNDIFMEIFKGDGCVSSPYFSDDIFKILWFSHLSQLISAKLNGIHVFGDGFGAFENGVKSVFGLEDVASSWIGKCVGHHKECGVNG